MVILYSTSEIALIFLEIRVKFLFLLNTPRREWLAFPASHKETGWWKHLYPWILHLEAVMLVDSKSMCSRVVFSPICEGNHVIYFSLGKKRKKESKTLFQMPCRLIIFFVILSSVFGFTCSNWHGMDLWGISVPLSSISHGGWGRFLHYTAVVLTLTNTRRGGAHISEDLSILSLAFTGDLRWLEEFAVKDTWIWVLKHLIV